MGNIAPAGAHREIAKHVEDGNRATDTRANKALFNLNLFGLAMYRRRALTIGPKASL
jgi:hypothetical protein